MSDRSPQLCTSASFPCEINEEWGWSLLAAHLLSKDEYFHLEEKDHQNLRKETDYYTVAILIDKSSIIHDTGLQNRCVLRY